MEVTDGLDQATATYLVGDFALSSEYCQKTLDKDPYNSGAWHLLGLIAHQLGKNEFAETLIKNAILLKNNDIWIIDVGQAVTNQHPNAEEFLVRDITRIVEWINRQGFDVKVADCLVRVLDDPVPILSPLPGGD